MTVIKMWMKRRMINSMRKELKNIDEFREEADRRESWLKKRIAQEEMWLLDRQIVNRRNVME